MLRDKEFAWLVAYIDSALIKHVKRELGKYELYKDIEAFIPTVKILTKTFKKTNTFDEVPLLFNYGFFKVPRNLALHKDFLDTMKKDISCIYAWVQDPHKLLASKPRMRLDDGHIYYNEYTKDSDIPVATATSEEIAHLLASSINIGAHSADDIGLLKEGDPIILRGYPFEGIEANIIKIDAGKKKVQVSINTGIFAQSKEISVSFDNVFFTIYHNKNYYPDELTKDSLDAMVGTNQLDKLFKKKDDESNRG